MPGTSGKYAPLGAYLTQASRDVLRMKFEDIEAILQAKLPPSAYAHRPWWSNNPSNNAMTKVWLDAGYETEEVNMRERRLVFRRQRTAGRAVADRGHGIDALFGQLRGLVRLEAGYDFTEPAAPEMAARQDRKYGAEPRKQR